MYEASMKERPVLVVVEELNLRPDEYALALLSRVSSMSLAPTSSSASSPFDWPLDRIALVDRLVMTLASAK